jgi:hypothetical protein
MQRPCGFYATSLFVRVADDVDTFDPAVWGITMYHFVRGTPRMIRCARAAWTQLTISPALLTKYYPPHQVRGFNNHSLGIYHLHSGLSRWLLGFAV